MLQVHLKLTKIILDLNFHKNKIKNKINKELSIRNTIYLTIRRTVIFRDLAQ